MSARASVLRATVSSVAVVLALLSALVFAGAAFAAGGSWSTAGFQLSAVRTAFVSAKLADGRVIVAGGANGPNGTATAEVLDAGGTGLTATGSMSVKRGFLAGAPLADGRLLAAGGAQGAGGDAMASAEVWSADSGTFTPTGAMNVARQSFSLTALPDGRALAAGGSANTQSGAGTATSELYDPASNAWTPSGSMHGGRLGHTGTLLANCAVLISGDNPTSELYNFKLGTFSQTGSESPQRSYHTATLLANGQVLIAGGVDGANQPLASASLYDPASGLFTPAGTMSVPRSQAAAALLRDGRVLVAGGFTSTTPLVATASADVYDPVANAWSPAPAMPEATDSAQAQTLNDGRVAVIGGDATTGRATQIYTPDEIGRPAVAAPIPDCSGLSGDAGPVDSTSPELKLSGGKRQRAGAAIKVRLTSSEDAAAVARGQVIVAVRGRRAASGTVQPQERKTRRFRLRVSKIELVAGTPQLAILRLKPKQRRQVKGLVARGARARAVVNVTVTDAAGNSSRSRRVVRLRR